MNYDLILEELGEFGPWQICIAMLLWLPAVIDGVQILLFSLTGISPGRYRCQLTECNNDNGSYFPEDDRLFYPFTESGKPNYCQHFKPRVNPDLSCDFSNLIMDNKSKVDCHSDDTFYYDKFAMDNSVITDFNLVCDKSILEPAVNSFFMIGLMIGSFVFGVLSDKYGRRHMLLVAILCASLGSLGGAFMKDYYTYVLFRMIAGAGSEGCFLIPFTLSMEVVGIKERVPFLPWVTYNTLLANFISIPLAGGEAIISALGFGIKDWRTLQIVASVGCLCVSIVWFLLPESPRWLITNEKWPQAKALILKAGKRNKVTIPDHLLIVHKETTDTVNTASVKDEKDDGQYSLRDLFHPSIRLMTGVMFVCWPVITLLYFGISYSVDKIHLTDNVFLSYILISLIEIPSYLALIVLMDIWGRKPLFVFSMLIPGVSCIAAAFLQSGLAFTILVLAGKFCASSAFNITYMYTAELFPTNIRNSAIGICSTIARLGGIAAPWVAVYLPDQGSLPDYVAYCVFGGLAVVGGMLALLLPDTIGFPLPDTFQDLEEIKAGSKPMFKLGTSHNNK